MGIYFRRVRMRKHVSETIAVHNVPQKNDNRNMGIHGNDPIGNNRKDVKI